MGRFVSGTGGIPRRKMVTLYASNAAVEVPSWAQGGKGRVLITGCGPGGSGGVSVSATGTGIGGGAGAYAVDHPMMIPAGVLSVGVVIGAPGPAVSSSIAANGNNGGNTSVSVSGLTLTLQGGLGGPGSGGPISNGGMPYVGSLPNSINITAGAAGPLAAQSTSSSQTGGSLDATLFAGATGRNGTTTPFGHGAHSPWGGGGEGASAVTGKVNGANATGFGAGGAGGTTYGTAGAATSGTGSPSFITLIFEEGF